MGGRPVMSGPDGVNVRGGMGAWARAMAAVAGLYGLGDEQRARHRRGQANAERSESRDDNTEAWVFIFYITLF